jgi:hypothetical protein
MISILQFDVADEQQFTEQLRIALCTLAARPGYRRGSAGRSTDDPGRWVLVTEWVNVGSYRRALGAYDVKINATPLLAQALDTPSAFEPLLTADPNAEPAAGASDRA